MTELSINDLKQAWNFFYEEQGHFHFVKGTIVGQFISQWETME